MDLNYTIEVLSVGIVMAYGCTFIQTKGHVYLKRCINGVIFWGEFQKVPNKDKYPYFRM